MKIIGHWVLLSCVALSPHTWAQTPIINTFAGNGTAAYSGDGGPATSASLAYPSGLAVDAAGDVYIADTYNECIRMVSPSGMITTVAGNGTKGFSGDGGPALSASLNLSSLWAADQGGAGIAVDWSGNLFIADVGNHRVRQISPSGIISTVAGNGTQGFSGDTGPATAASLNTPHGVAVDPTGNVYIADTLNNRIRLVSPNGMITTVAGGGKPPVGVGDGGPATGASLRTPYGVAVDSYGNLLVADGSGLRVVPASGIIQTVAVGCVAVAADFSGNLFLIGYTSAVNTLGEVDSGGVVFKVSGVDGTTSTIGGFGANGYTGDGGPARNALFNSPFGIGLDYAGNLYIADSGNNRVRIVPGVAATSQAISISPGSLSLSLAAGASVGEQITLAGSAGVVWNANSSASWISIAPTTGTAPGTVTATVNTAGLQPGVYFTGITFSNPGAYPAQETVNLNLTVLASDAVITVAPSELSFELQQGSAPQSLQIGGTVGANWQAQVLPGTGGTWLSVSPVAGQVPATLTAAVNAGGLAPGSYQASIAIQSPDAMPSNTTIDVSLTVSAAAGPPGTIVTVAGGGQPSAFNGDGGPATSAAVSAAGLVLDNAGNLFISGGSVVRKVTVDGIINTFAGGGNPVDRIGNNLPATQASLDHVYGIAIDASGNFYIADGYHSMVRKVSANGIITTYAGTGSLSPDSAGSNGGYSGDGGLATLADLSIPAGLCLDSNGNLFIGDSENGRVREVSSSDIITSVAGISAICYEFGIPIKCGGYGGDGGPATSAQLNEPQGVAVDSSGNLFIADYSNHRVRKVSPNGIITTVAGNGNAGFGGDGGAAVAAQLNHPVWVAVDTFGNLFIADVGNNRIREVSGGIISTVAGNGIQGFGGEGGPAISAQLNAPNAVVVDSMGNLFIADSGNNRVREVFAGSVADIRANNK